MKTKSLIKANSQQLTARNLDNAFGNFLRLDVANGDASRDTIRGYRTQVAQWVEWCKNHCIDPAIASVDDVKTYRADLVKRDFKPATIAYKLVIIRRLYTAAVNAGLRDDNPAAGVKPPREKRATEDFGYLSEGELQLLFQVTPKTDRVKDLRDRAILALLALQGLRTIEIERACVEDMHERDNVSMLLVRGKGRDRLVCLRPDVTQVLALYLATRSEVKTDHLGTPLFTAADNCTAGGRMGRRGIRKTVDTLLRKANLKRPGISDHALRHTAATLAYRYSHDLRAVQDMLGHADPKTTSRYARVVDMAKDNPALAVPINL